MTPYTSPQLSFQLLLSSIESFVSRNVVSKPLFLCLRCSVQNLSVSKLVQMVQFKSRWLHCHPNDELTSFGLEYFRDNLQDPAHNKANTNLDCRSRTVCCWGACGDGGLRNVGTGPAAEAIWRSVNVYASGDRNESNSPLSLLRVSWTSPRHPASQSF